MKIFQVFNLAVQRPSITIFIDYSPIQSSTSNAQSLGSIVTVASKDFPITTIAWHSQTHQCLQRFQISHIYKFTQLIQRRSVHRKDDSLTFTLTILHQYQFQSSLSIIQDFNLLYFALNANQHRQEIFHFFRITVHAVSARRWLAVALMTSPKILFPPPPSASKTKVKNLHTSRNHICSFFFSISLR